MAERSGGDSQQPSELDNVFIRLPSGEITTYVSSGRYGIDVINYLPSEKESASDLKIPRYKGGHIFQLDIRIWPDGQITVSRLYPASDMEQRHPGLLDLNGHNIQFGNMLGRFIPGRKQ